MLHIFLLTLAISGLIGGVITAVAILLNVAGTADEILIMAGSIIGVWTFCILIFWIARSHLQLASWLFIGLLLVVGIFSDTAYNVVSGRTLLLFALPVILASVLLGPFKSFLIATLASLIIAVFSFQQQIIPNPGFVVLYLIALMVGLVMSNLERILAEWRSARSRLALFNQAGRVLGTTLEPDLILSNVLMEIRNLLSVDTVSVWLVDPSSGELICRQSITGEAAGLLSGYRIAAGQGFVGWVAQMGESLAVSDAQRDERYFQEVEGQLGLTLRSILSVPLRAHEQTIGVLQVADERIGRFSDEDANLLEPLAASAAVAIENARLYQETDRLRVFNETIVCSMQEGILIEDDEGFITFANPAAAQFLGYEEGELVGRHWTAFVPREHIEAVATELAQRPYGISSQYDTELLAKGGRHVPVIVSASPIFDGDQFAGVLSVFTDITERKRAEEELRCHTVDLQARNEELDAFAHTVAHDLKNPLALIAGYAEVLELNFTTMPQERVREHLHTVATMGYKACDIVDSLLLLSAVRTKEISTKPLHMDEVITVVRKRLDYALDQAGAELVSPEEWPVAVGYGPWIEEVWVNFITNAIKYGGAPPMIELGSDHDSDGKIRFWVRDNGPGLTPEQQSRLFKPFTRLRPGSSNGHGLGLSIALRIANRLGGSVGVESELGHGSCFYFTLPAFASEDGSSDEAL